MEAKTPEDVIAMAGLSGPADAVREEDWKENLARQRTECAEMEAAARARLECEKRRIEAQRNLQLYVELERGRPLTSDEIKAVGMAMLALAEPAEMKAEESSDLHIAAVDYCQRYASWRHHMEKKMKEAA